MCIIFPHLHFFSHENTKDKREANPEAWDLQEEDVYGEPRRIHNAKYVQLFFLVCSSLNFEFPYRIAIEMTLESTY